MLNESQQSKLNQSIANTIEQYDLDFNIGNALMSILNAGYHDNPVQELEKARYLIERRIILLKKQQESNSYIAKEWRE